MEQHVDGKRVSETRTLLGVLISALCAGMVEEGVDHVWPLYGIDAER